MLQGAREIAYNPPTRATLTFLLAGKTLVTERALCRMGT